MMKEKNRKEKKKKECAKSCLNHFLYSIRDHLVSDLKSNVYVCRIITNDAWNKWMPALIWLVFLVKWKRMC